MSTQALSIGYPQLMTQNQIYAMPANNICRATCDDATATFQVSNDGSTFTAATLSGSGFDNAFAFIRVTNKDATINIRKWVA